MFWFTIKKLIWLFCLFRDHYDENFCTFFNDRYSISTLSLKILLFYNNFDIQFCKLLDRIYLYKDPFYIIQFYLGSSLYYELIYLVVISWRIHLVLVEEVFYWFGTRLYQNDNSRWFDISSLLGKSVCSTRSYYLLFPFVELNKIFRSHWTLGFYLLVIFLSFNTYKNLYAFRHIFNSLLT